MTRDELQAKIIFLRLTAEDADLVSARAERLGMSRTEYVRHLVWRALGKPCAIPAEEAHGA